MRRGYPYKVSMDRDVETDTVKVEIVIAFEEIENIPFGGIPQYFVTKKGTDTVRILNFPENREALSYSLAALLETCLELEHANDNA